MKCVEINIKEGMPEVAVALKNLQMSIDRAKSNKVTCLVVVHGYGSTGKGGAICKRARAYLLGKVKSGQLKKVIFGEDFFDVTNLDAIDLVYKFPELIDYRKNCNHGVTIIVL